MNFIEFDYTKATGAKSHRVIVTSQSSSKHVSGIDVTSLSQEDQAAFGSECADAEQAYFEALQSIQNKYDLKHNFRQFDPAKMTEVSVEKIQLV